MTSTFGWLDHDDAERRRMMEIVNLFREKGTLDELGIGTIRDAFAEHFFPGINTIQTRARYFLFVPWIYEQIEKARVPSANAERHARERQARLVEALKAGGMGAKSGLIGIDAGVNLQRLPASIYWSGIGRWGIRSFEGSLEKYQQSLDSHHREERAARVADGGELIDEARRNWHPSLPPAPISLLDKVTFDLTAVEADFLAERIRQAVSRPGETAGALLASVISGRLTRVKASGQLWDLGGIDTLDASLVTDIGHARKFSLLMEGATILYHLLLAEAAAARTRPDAPKWVDNYERQIGRWMDEVSGQLDELRVWNRAEMMARVLAVNPRIHPRVTRFVSAWMELALEDPRSIRARSAVGDLIKAREYQTKRSLARLSNPKALERYDGGPGNGMRLNFRWPGAKVIILDILAGGRLPIDVA